MKCKNMVKNIKTNCKRIWETLESWKEIKAKWWTVQLHMMLSIPFSPLMTAPWLRMHCTAHLCGFSQHAASLIIMSRCIYQKNYTSESCLVECKGLACEFVCMEKKRLNALYALCMCICIFLCFTVYMSSSREGNL